MVIKLIYMYLVAPFLIGLIFSLFSYYIIIYKQTFLNNIMPDNFSGPQKIHDDKILRIGGLIIFLSLALQSFFVNEKYLNFFIIFIICLFPVFLFGFIEDITNKVTPLLRLLSSIISGLIFVILTGFKITSVGIYAIDLFLVNDLVAFSFTIASIVILGQSFNIIDGLNGLSVATGLIMLCSIIYISTMNNQNEVFYIGLLFLPIMISFLIFNFPFGKIFLGDGGAYLIGTFLALLIILLVSKKIVFSPFTILLIVLYPIYEVLRTFFRRFFAKRSNVAMPDTQHMHSLIYKFIYLSRINMSKWKVNAIASLVTLIFPIFSCSWSILYLNNKRMLILGVFIYFIVIECVFYFLKMKLKYYEKL